MLKIWTRLKFTNFYEKTRSIAAIGVNQGVKEWYQYQYSPHPTRPPPDACTHARTHPHTRTHAQTHTHTRISLLKYISTKHNLVWGYCLRNNMFDYSLNWKSLKKHIAIMVQKELESGAGINNLNLAINYSKLISKNFSFKVSPVIFKTTSLHLCLPSSIRE